jgi:hypothetical protein
MFLFYDELGQMNTFSIYFMPGFHECPIIFGPE